MENWQDIPTKTIQATDDLFKYIKGETIDDVNKSVQNLSKRIKASFYLALAVVFLIIGVVVIGTQLTSGNYLLEAAVYFSATLFCILSFGIIVWRIWK